MREEGLLKLFFSGVAAARGGGGDAAARCASTASTSPSELRALEPEAIDKADGFPLMVLRGGIEFTGGSPTGASGWRPADPRRRRGKEQLMFDTLARLADRHARRIGLIAIAFFLLAGALGGSVAEPARPLRRRRPGHGGGQGEEQLEDAGLRVPGVVVVVKNAPVVEPATRAEGRGNRTRARRRADVASVSSYYTRALPISSPRRQRDLSRSRAEADRRQGDGRNRRRHRRTARGPARSHRRRRRRRPGAGQQAGREGPERAELLAFPLLFLLSFVFFRSLVASLLPVMIGALAIVGTFLILRVPASSARSRSSRST